MDKINNTILSLIRLDKTIRYHGSMEKLLLLMNELANGQTCKQDLRVEKIGDKSFTIEPEDNTPLEMSTSFSYFRQDGTINIKLKSNSPDLQLIHCTTKIRPVLYGVLSFYLFIIGFDIFFSKDGASAGVIVGWSIFWFFGLLLGNFYWSQKEIYVLEEFKTALYILMKVSK